VPAPAPVATHAAAVMSVHALEPATEVEPVEHAVGVEEPAGQ